MFRFNVPYDSQEAVYKQMLKELDEVSSVLKENLTIGSEAFRKFDDVYYGDVSKWYKFANSLKLRMAIRMVYVDPTTAQQVAQDAVDAGVITDNADNAEMKVEENRAAMVFNGWSDHRMGADLLCYMNGYQDLDGRRCSLKWKSRKQLVVSRRKCPALPVFVSVLMW